MVTSLGSLIVILLVLGVVCYIITLTPIPEPFRKGIIVVISLVALIIVVKFLFGLSGVSFN